MAGMAMFASNLSSEMGLKLLLSPLNTNVIVRTACCSVGIVLPVYSTFKAIETGNRNEQHKWLLYWAAYGSFRIVEAFTDKFLYWFPLYYHVKLAFLVWLQLPSAEGAKQLYTNHLCPFLMRHQARLDHILELFHGELIFRNFSAMLEEVKKLLSCMINLLVLTRQKSSLQRRFLAKLYYQLEIFFNNLRKDELLVQLKGQRSK
ncbi:HVA22-like protein k isoform X1 [Solanum tuberosum]|uniref:HVA22-like protein k isoform X1 n=1 Tax=Solanum tuberosum TaxID=4113 RepID=UPI00073A1CCB|nr:PREDICTED: HVA22-like protein k isoform X1 [Solanum tuberosum]